MSELQKLDQAAVDKMVDSFKSQILEICDGVSVAMSIACGKKPEILENFFAYQEILLPQVVLNGYTAPSLTDLFGFEIQLTVKGDNDQC